MKIAVHGRAFKPEVKDYIQILFDELARRGATLQMSNAFAKVLSVTEIKHYTTDFYEDNHDLFDADFVLTLGGDGTLLDAVTHVGARQIPLLGINTGRLGFLANVSPQGVSKAMKQLFANEFEIEERSLISVKTSPGDIFGELNFGLNEFGIQKTDTSSMITIHSKLDGQELNTYWADGLIVSTPTGSTGYCLSVGGPLVMPMSENFVVAPMSPHNLNVRPLVVSDKSELTFEVESRSGSFLVSLDSRYEKATTSMCLSVKKANFVARLVKMPDTNFLETLRSKLNWGADVRN
jgi:NAD+ kinase